MREKFRMCVKDTLKSYGLGLRRAERGEIRRRYVDDAAIVVAMGKRLANVDVNRLQPHWAARKQSLTKRV